MMSIAVSKLSVAVESYFSCVEQSDWGEIRQRFRRASRFLEKKRFGAFRRDVGARSSFERGLMELFIMSRIHKYALAYLSVQEGEDFEGKDQYDTSAPQLINDVLLRLSGKSPQCGYRLGFGPLRLSIGLDPLTHLRSIYRNTLANPEREGVWKRFRRSMENVGHSVLFRAKSFAIKQIVKRTLSKSRDTIHGNDIRRLFRKPEFRRILAMLFVLLFPSAKALKKKDWEDLFLRLEDYFSVHLPKLFSVLPDHSIQNHGLIKLAKVAFGTLVGRSASPEAKETVDVNFLAQSAILAYSWGITYPLVDNILDSHEVSDLTKSKLSRILLTLFEGQAVNSRDLDEPILVEVHERLCEVIDLIPLANRTEALRVLHSLLQVHYRESNRALSQFRRDKTQERNIVEDTVAKSSLVRLATMEICGINTGENTVRKCEVRGLYNQLGDDLWDIYEDRQEDSATPFTAFLTVGGTTDPFKAYVAYATSMSRQFPRRRSMATSIGCLETLRDSLLELERSDFDTLGVVDRINQTLRDVGVEKNSKALLADVPHIDFDAILFLLEEGILH